MAGVGKLLVISFWLSFVAFQTSRATRGPMDEPPPRLPSSIRGKGDEIPKRDRPRGTDRPHQDPASAKDDPVADRAQEPGPTKISSGSPTPGPRYVQEPKAAKNIRQGDPSVRRSLLKKAKPSDWRIQSCRIEGGSEEELEKYPGLQEFITEELPLFYKVVYQPIPGLKPRVVMLNKEGEELNKVNISNFKREKIVQLLDNMGFYRKQNKDDEIPESRKKNPIQLREPSSGPNLQAKGRATRNTEIKGEL